MATTAFASVKLPSNLVEKAREAAQPMRRSVASQIEYWATLGQIVEHTGLSVQEARAAIEHYEAIAERQHAAAPASVDALTARLLAAEAQGTLAQRVRSVVQDNRAQPSPEDAQGCQRAQRLPQRRGGSTCWPSPMALANPPSTTPWCAKASWGRRSNS